MFHQINCLNVKFYSLSVFVVFFFVLCFYCLYLGLLKGGYKYDVLLLLSINTNIELLKHVLHIIDIMIINNVISSIIISAKENYG